MKILDNVVRADGKWGDVVVSPGGRVVWVYSVNGAVVCEVDGMQAWRTLVPTDFLRYTKGTAVPELAAIGQSSDDAAFIVTHSGPQHQGFAPGQNAVAFGPDGLPYIMRSGRSYSKGTEIFHVPLTSQGIRDVLPDGTVVMGDDANHTFIKGHEFWQYQKRGDITVGQAGTDIGLAVLYKNDYLVIPRQGDPQGVHVADLNDGRIAVCAWTVHGAELWMIDLFAPSEPKPAPAPKPPTPTPQTPKPEPPIMEAKALPSDIHAIVVQLYERNLDLANGDDEDRRALQRKINETVRARKGARYGSKSNHGVGIAMGKDSIAELPEGTSAIIGQRQPLHIWDLFVGSTRKPKPHPIMSETEDVNQFFWPVPPIDHLADVPVEPDEPDPRPTPKPPAPSPQPDALAGILKRLDALEGPRTVSIKSSRDRYMRDEWTDNTARFDRTAVGSGEQFTIEPIK